MPDHDVVVVGAGPNGLAAAILFARAGLSVLVIEGESTIGGGTRTTELTNPGFLHDVCSAVHPLAATSPYLSTLPLARYGLRWIEPSYALAHPFDDQPPAILQRDLAKTAESLGADRDEYVRLFTPLVDNWGKLAPDVLAPLHIPRDPLLLARFGVHALRSANALFRRFGAGRASAMLGAIASHALQPLSTPGTAAIALILATLAHRRGWPFAAGGSQSITTAMANYLRDMGGRIEVGRPIRGLADIPSARATLLALTPHNIVKLFGDAFPRRYALALRRFKYGPGVFKVDWALSAPVPWRWQECHGAGTLHLGGTLDVITHNEELVARGEHPEHPTVLLAQPSGFDASRAPVGCATLWGYCHVPHGSTVNMLPRIEAQVERFAPGFRDCIIARHTMNTVDFEHYDPNIVGGDIGQGANTLRQLFLRPVARLSPYTTPIRGLYLCSSSTPPGGGVHGMCGYHAARRALRDIFGISSSTVMPLARET